MRESQTRTRILRRSALPEVIFPGDAAIVLQVPKPVAEARLASGALGPAFTVHGRPAVLRDAFISALAQRASVLPQSRTDVLQRAEANDRTAADPHAP